MHTWNKCDVEFVVINCDDREVTYHYESMESFRQEWFKEDDPRVPMLDDKLVSARVEGAEYHGSTFLDVMNAMSIVYGWRY